MTIIRPATPGFLVTLTATILLAIVSFCVPYFKSIYFLKAGFTYSGVSGSITFGTLGYCLDIPGNTTCSSPSVGYQLDINGLVGNKLPIDIPQVAVKWITYALVLHIVALALSAGSAIFGLLAHIREMSMTCCSSCVSGFAAAVALLAFIFDIALFFIAKARINAVEGGHAEIGHAVWLTLAAWILLFFSGCFYTMGRCCITKRSPRDNWKRGDNAENGNGGYGEQMRLDAVKAEADRKARQKQMEVGLPAFHETQPLTARIEGDNVYIDDDNATSPHGNQYNSGPSTAAAIGGRRPSDATTHHRGYQQVAAGQRAVDEYYNPTSPVGPQRQGSSHTTATAYGAGYAADSSYPPQPSHPSRQASGHTLAPSQYHNVSSTPAPLEPTHQYLYASGQYGNDRQGSHSPNPREQYGHMGGGTSFHSAVSHQQSPSNYVQYDQYSNPHAQPDTQYNQGGPTDYLTAHYQQPPAGFNTGGQQTPYYSAHSTPALPTPDRHYTLGGDGYGESSVPPLNDYSGHQHDAIGALPFPGETRQQSPSPINTNIGPARGGMTSPRGPRVMSPEPDFPPPTYEMTPSPGHAGNVPWSRDEKR